MIQIKPTTESALNHAEHSLDLIWSLSLDRPRAKKVSTTLDGGIAATIWRKTKLGATASKEFTLTPDQFTILNNIVYHSICFEWLVFSDSDRFRCEIDYQPLGKVTINGNPDYQRVNISFLVTEVL